MMGSASGAFGFASIGHFDDDLGLPAIDAQIIDAVDFVVSTHNGFES